MPVPLHYAAAVLQEDQFDRNGHEPERTTSLTFGNNNDDVLLSPTDSLLTSSYATPSHQPADAASLPTNHHFTWQQHESQPAATPVVVEDVVSVTTVPASQTHHRKNASNCYFPSEYQGIYQVQSSIDPQGRVQYDQVEIGPQDISVWGTCHTLMGNHVLLHIGYVTNGLINCKDRYLFSTVKINEGRLLVRLFIRLHTL